MIKVTAGADILKKISIFPQDKKNFLKCPAERLAFPQQKKNHKKVSKTNRIKIIMNGPSVQNP